MLWNPLQPRGIQRNAQSQAYAPDAWTDGDLRFRWSSEAGGVLEVSGIPGRPLPYQMSCPSPSEGRRWTPTLAGMLRAGRLPPEGVFRVSSQLPPPGSMDGRGGIVVGMYKGSGSEEWRTIRGHHILMRDGQPVNTPPWMNAGEHKDAPASPAQHSHSLAAMGKVRDFLHGDPGASKLLKTPYKALVEGGACKTTGHCYAASEALYHHLGGKEAGWTPQSVQHEGGPHWFLKHKDGTVLDPTHDQFKTPVPVHQATGKGFLTKEPSKRAVAIMKASGLGGGEMAKGRQIVILSKGKKVSGPVAFLTDKTDGHVFPVSANSPKAAAALNTPRHREIAEKIHRETKDPEKKKVQAEHLASLGGQGGDNPKAEAPAADAGGGVASQKASGPSVRERRWKPIAQAHITKLRMNHTASLLGQIVKTPRKLAELAQVYRDGRYETMRFFWMRGNKIVGHTGVSSRLAARVAVKPFDVPDADFIPWIEKQKELHGADSYYLLHNHPDGDPAASRADLATTLYIAQRVQGFKSHVVINSGKYAVIEAYQEGGEPISKVSGQRLAGVAAETRRLMGHPPERATEEHDAIGKLMRGSEELAAVAKGFQAEKGWVTMIGIGAKGGVNAITQVSADTYRHKARGRAAIRAFAISTGSVRVVGAAPASENAISDEEIDERFRDGLLSDHITQEGDTYHSWREQNIWHDKKPDTDMGRVVSKSSRVTVQETLAKGRSMITILFKGKRITGPVAFLTNKEDGHVFPVSASDPKAVAAMNTPRHREIVEKIHAETTDPKKKAVHAEHLAMLDRLAGASEHPADKRFGELLAEGKVADEDREHFRKFYDKFDNQKNIPAGTRANMTAMYYETQAHRRERDERTRKEQAELERMAAEREQRIRERREEIARIQADAIAAIKKITGDRDVAQLDESEIQRAMKIAKDANLTQQEGSFRGEIVRRDKEEKAKTEALGQEARAIALRADIANAKEIGHRVQEKNGNLLVEDRPGAFSQGAIVSVNGKAHRVDGAGQAYSRIEGPRSPEPGEMAFRRGEEGSRRSGGEADGYTVGQMIRDRRSGKWFRVTSTHSEYIPSDGMSFGYGFDRGWAHNAIARPATEEESAPHEQRHQAQQDKKTALSDLKALHANLKGETEGETNKIVADTQQHERIKIPTERALGGPLTEGEFRIGPDTITAYHPGYYDDYTETARQVKRTPELEDKIRQLHAKATQEIPTGRIDLPDMKGKPYHAEGQRQRFYLKPVETDAPASRQEGPRDSQPAGSAAMEPTPHDDTVMRFGKHSGRTLKQVADTDPGYLRWAAENLSNEPLRKKAQAVYQRHVMRKGRAIKSRQIVVMFKGDVASTEPLTTGSYSPGPAPRSGRRRFITEDDVRARARELSVRQRSREFIQRIHDGTQDPAKKAAHAARLEAYGPALAPPPGRQRKEKPFTGSITFQGIPIAIESEKGTWREGVGRDGKPWRVKMNAHYGEIHGWGTLGTDGDKLDAYVGPVADASHAYVIDQLHPDSGAFDEQKVMLGFPSESAAKAAYLAQFDKPGFYGGIHPIPMDVLKAKLRDKGLRGQPISHGRPVVVLSSSSR